MRADGRTHWQVVCRLWSARTIAKHVPPFIQSASKISSSVQERRCDDELGDEVFGSADDGATVNDLTDTLTDGCL